MGLGDGLADAWSRVLSMLGADRQPVPPDDCLRLPLYQPERGDASASDSLTAPSDRTVWLPLPTQPAVSRVSCTQLICCCCVPALPDCGQPFNEMLVSRAHRRVDVPPVTPALMAGRCAHGRLRMFRESHNRAVGCPRQRAIRGPGATWRRCRSLRACQRCRTP